MNYFYFGIVTKFMSLFQATVPTMTREETYAEKLKNIPELAALGPPFHSSPPMDLTESETEYLVRCIKHVYERHLVLQFNCTNTLNDQLLEKVRVQLDVPEGFVLLKEIPCPKLPYGEPQSCFAVLEFPTSLPNSVGMVLHFSLRNCDLPFLVNSRYLWCCAEVLC
jgi:coatomer subunit gamma